MLLTGEQKNNHTAEGLRGPFCMKPSVPLTPECHHRQEMHMFWGLKANLMPSLHHVQQLRVVTLLMQNVTTALRGRCRVIASLNTPLYTDLLISPLLA